MIRTINAVAIVLNFLSLFPLLSLFLSQGGAKALLCFYVCERRSQNNRLLCMQNMSISIM